jgi:hypothetical protein
MTNYTSKRPLALALAMSAALVGGAAVADGHAIDLEGKTVEWIIPFSETGGSAKWANFYAPLLAEALPGNPTVVVVFDPGAGSTKGANNFQEMTYEDVRYEYADWNVVLASGTGGVAYLPTDLAGMLGDGGDASGIAGEDFIYGSQGATRLDLVPLLAWEMLGLNVEPVFGIEGRGDGRLMFERGEANIDYQTSSSYLSGVTPLVEAGTATPWFAFGALDDDGNVVRDPTFPDMPSFKEVCDATDGCETSGAQWDAWKAFFTAGFPAQKMVFLPAGAPQAAIDTYTQAFEDVKARADFAEISGARLGVYPQMTGAAAQVALASGTDVRQEAKDFVINWLSERYGVVLQ